MTREEKISSKRSPARVNPVIRHPAESRMTLDGTWEFALDPADEGIAANWHKPEHVYAASVIVPGCWQGQGHGHDGEDEIWDFRLGARVFQATYEGTGWYRKKFRVPASWKGKRIWVNFGGVHPSADVWINGKLLGRHSAPFVPFAFDVTNMVMYDSENCLVVRVSEEDRWLGFSYNWQGNWSGLYRSVELTATGQAWIDKLWIHPDRASACMKVVSRVDAAAGFTGATLKIIVEDPAGQVVAEKVVGLRPGVERRFKISVPSPASWSPDQPRLYTVHAELMGEDETLDALSERTGFVTLDARGKHFLINDEPFYMRGSGDFSACPESGSPDVDRVRWRRKLRNLKAYGYNYVRCQSYVPTPEYLDVADEVGIIVQCEMGTLGAWSGVSVWHGYAWPEPEPNYRERLRWQWNQTVIRDVNHPSATIYCMSNEQGSLTLYPEMAWRCYRETKAIKPSSMVIWTDGGYSPKLPGDFVNAEASLEAKCRKPLIQHEFRWWSAYPDVRTKDKYTGAVRPYAIELAERKAAERGASDMLDVIALNSQRLQYIESRGKLEACRRDNPTLAGICHFNAMDIGFSPQGVLDEFYDPKGTSAEEWLRTWGDTVILIDRDFDDRILAASETIRIRFSVSDFSHPPLKWPALIWELVIGDRVVADGRTRYRHRPHRTVRTPSISIKLPSVAKPREATLRARLEEGERCYCNEWKFWIMPNTGRLPESVGIYSRRKRTWLRQLNLPTISARQLAGARPRAVLTDLVDRTLLEYMRGGGRVLLVASEGLVRPFNPKLGLTTGRYFFLPPANYPPYDRGHGGTIIDAHDMLGAFPHDRYADLQFYRMMSESPPVDLTNLGGWDTEPVIRVLSTYFVPHPLSYLVEFRVGRGGLIVSALDLSQRWPEARVLLASILKYAVGSSFKPTNCFNAEMETEILRVGEAS